MNLKELFDKAENGTFTYDQFVEAAKLQELNSKILVKVNMYQNLSMSRRLVQKIKKLKL